MKWFSLLAIGAGLALLAWILLATDLRQVGTALSALRWPGVLVVLAVFAAGFAAEIAAWAYTFLDRALTAAWLARLWLVNMVGEALNVVMPFGSLGGEPVKAYLLQQHYGVPYRDSAPTLLLMQILLAVAEAVFALVGVLLALRIDTLPADVERTILAATVVLMAAMAATLTALHLRWLRNWLAPIASRSAGLRMSQLLAACTEVEQRLFDFARHSPRQFAWSLLLFFANWLLGVVEVWIIMQLLGAPLGFGACWTAEVAIVLARSATFFVPAQIGSTEAATVLVIGALTGNPEVGLALAVVRRARELLWSAVGLGIGAWYHVRAVPGSD